MMERVVVQLHAGDSPEAVVKKVWRFDTSNIEQYDRGAVEAELVQLFPDVARKGLKFDLCLVRRRSCWRGKRLWC